MIDFVEERRKSIRKKVFLQGEIKLKDIKKNLPVWIKDISKDGMRLIFFKMFYCNKCPRLKDILHLKCDEKQKCKIYNFENLPEIFSNGEVFANIEGNDINKKYTIRWYKSFIDLNTIEFGIEFLN